MGLSCSWKVSIINVKEITRLNNFGLGNLIIKFSILLNLMGNVCSFRNGMNINFTYIFRDLVIQQNKYILLNKVNKKDV